MTTPTPQRPTRSAHTAGSAAMLLMASAIGSGLLAVARIAYVNFLFGAGPAQDAYRAAFTLPNLLNYFLIGGAASISVITILSRYREAGDEAGGDRALSIILNNMVVVLLIGALLAEIFAPQYIWLANKGFRTDAVRSSLAIGMTRIIIPGQIFFFIGSIMSSRLQVRKIFIYQAFTPLIYNSGIILGAFFFHTRFNIYSLAIGVLGGVIAGSALLNSIGAFRTGLHYTPIVRFRDPAFIEWLKLSLPLMIGVSLVMFDGILLNYFASVREGGITLIGNAKDLFSAPFNVIGSAAGAASLPFFASLFQQKRMTDFSTSVTRAVSRLFAVGMLVSAWMIALAPWLMDLFRHGKFTRDNAEETSHLFILLSFTLAIWAVQGIYARAFYAAGDTKTPAITGTVIVVLSAPIYWAFFHAFGLRGLAIASDIGIVIQTVALTALLHKKRLVSFSHLEFDELRRAFIAAIIAFFATSFVTRWLPVAFTSRGKDIVTLTVASMVWGTVTLLVLLALRSKLPAQILRRKT